MYNYINIIYILQILRYLSLSIYRNDFLPKAPGAAFLLGAVSGTSRKFHLPSTDFVGKKPEP